MTSIPDGEYFLVRWVMPKVKTDRRERETPAKMQTLGLECAGLRMWDLVEAAHGRGRDWRPRPTAAVVHSSPQIPDSGAPETGTGSAGEKKRGPPCLGSDGGNGEEPELNAGGAPPTRKLKRQKTSAPLSLLQNSLVRVLFRTLQDFDTALLISNEEEEADVISR